MKESKGLLILTIPIILLSAEGCSYNSQLIQTGAESFSAVSPSQVKVYAGDKPGIAKYKVIGSISVNVFGDPGRALSDLRAKAASLGANAVIQARLSLFNTMGARSELQGVAVRTN